MLPCALRHGHHCNLADRIFLRLPARLHDQRRCNRQQGMNSIAALNAGTMNREPRNVHEAVQMIQDANRMVDNGVIALMKFLHKAPDNLHLLGIDQEGVDIIL